MEDWTLVFICEEKKNPSQWHTKNKQTKNLVGQGQGQRDTKW